MNNKPSQFDKVRQILADCTAPLPEDDALALKLRSTLATAVLGLLELAAIDVHQPVVRQKASKALDRVLASWKKPV